MALLDEIEAIEDAEELPLVVPMWKTAAHPDGITVLFRGMTFKTLVDIQGTFDIANVEKNDLESMITLVRLTAYDPETRERLFDSERGAEVLRNKGYKTLLFLVQKGASVVIGTDETETAGKDSSSMPEESRASDDYSSESPETRAELSESY